MENIRHWYLQKPKEHNRPHNDNVAVFQEFKPTIAFDGFEWIKVISLDDFHKEAGINITKYIQLQKDLALAKEGLEFYGDGSNWFKKWGHKDNWAIEGSSKKAKEILNKLDKGKSE